MNVFAQITKVDVAKREVWGRAAQETPDHSGEILDYATSKAYFQEWSDEVSNVTKGKSLGNIRSMHSNVAAGKMISMTFNDADKAIDIGTKIVDDNEWEKVLEGVHTGFSIGGSYISKWDDGDLTRYTAKPSEISLVDRPCIPTALFFDVVKQDGTVMQKAFKSQPKETNVTTETKEQGAVDALAALINKGDISVTEVLELAKARVASGEHKPAQADAAAQPDAVHKADGAGGASDEMPTGPSGETTDTMRTGQDDTRSETGTNGTTDNYPKVGQPVSFAWGDARSQGTIKELSADGGVATIEAGLAVFTVATAYFKAGEGQGQNGSPMWEVNLMDGPAKKSLSAADIAKAVRVAMQKGMYGVSNLASILQSIAYLQEDTAWEAEYEQDGSTLPAAIKTWLADGGKLLQDMVAEEVAELAGGDDVDADGMGVMMLSEHGGLLAKIGARNSAADMAKIQGIHDHACSLGAACTADQLDEIINSPENNDSVTDMGSDEFFDSNAMMMSDKVGTLKKAMHVAKSVAPTLRKQLKDTTDKLGKAHEDVAKLKGEKDALEKRVQELEALPAQTSAVLKSVGKEGDVIQSKEPEVKPVMKHTGEEDAVATAFKKVHAQGGTHLRRI